MATLDPSHSYEFGLNDALERAAADLGALAIAGGTVLAHSRPTTIGVTNVIAGQWTAGQRSWVLFYTGAQALSMYWSPDGSSVNSHGIVPGGGSDPLPHDAVAADEWRFVGNTFTTGAGNNQMFIDGTPLGAGGAGGTLYGASSTAPLRFGSSDGGAEDYLGQIFNVMIWSDVLTDEQIAAQRTSFKPVTFTNLQGWWPMLSGIIDGRDMSGNGRDMAAVNSPTLVTQVPAYVLGIETGGSIGTPPYSGTNIATQDL